MAILPPDPVFCLKSDMGYVHSLCFPQNDPSSSNLIAASESGYIYTWDLETNRLRGKQNLGESIQAIHCTEDNLITQEKSGVVKVWNIKNETDYELLNKYECNGGYCRSLLLGNILILPQDNSTLDAINIHDMERVRTFAPSKQKLGNVMCLQKVELASNTYILAGFETGDIILWDFLTAKSCGQLQLRECITSLTFDPVTSRGICGNASNILQVFTIDKTFKITLKCDISITNPGCNIVKLRPDRKIFVCGGWDGRLRLFSWKSLRLLVVLTEHRASITDVQFSPSTVQLWNSNIMAAGGADGLISLWNLYN